MPANQRVNLAVFGKLVQVLRVLLQRRLFLIFLRASFFVFSRTLTSLGRLGRIALFNAVGNKVDDVKPCHALLVQVVHSVRIFFTKNSHQHIGASHFFFTIASRLHVHYGALDHTLKAQRRLSVHVIGARNLRRVVLDEVAQRFAQIINVGRTGFQDFSGAGVVQQS